MNEDRLSDYVSGRLSSSERARLERALDGCALCRGELESLQQTRALLQALPQEPLPRSFVFAEAPAVAAAGVYPPAEASGFRMPAWAYAGAAAVAGLAVIVFFLSGAVGTWLPQGAEDESGRVASTSTLEVAQAQSAPAPASAPAAMQEAQPEAPAEPAMESAMVAESEELELAPFADSASPQEASAAAEVAREVEVLKEVEVAKEVVVERAVEAQVESAPTAVPVMAAQPHAAAMADVPPPTAAPVAAQEATAREPEVEVPVEAEITVSQAAAGHADVEPATPTIEAQADAVPSAPAAAAASKGEEAEATAMPEPVARRGELSEPALMATVAPETAQDAVRTPEEPPATPMPLVTVPAITPEPAIVAPTAIPIATVPLPMPTLEPPVSASTTSAVDRAGVQSEPTPVPTLKLEPDRAEPDLAAGGVEPGGPAGPVAQMSPVGPAAAEGPSGPVGLRGSQGGTSQPVPEGAEEAQSLQGPQDPQGEVGAPGPAGVDGEGAAGLLRDNSTLTVLLGVVAVALLVVGLWIVLRIRSARGPGAPSGTNYGPDTSTLVNRPKLEN